MLCRQPEISVAAAAAEQTILVYFQACTMQQFYISGCLNPWGKARWCRRLSSKTCKAATAPIRQMAKSARKNSIRPGHRSPRRTLAVKGFRVTDHPCRVGKIKVPAVQPRRIFTAPNVKNRKSASPMCSCSQMKPTAWASRSHANSVVPYSYCSYCISYLKYTSA